MRNGKAGLSVKCPIVSLDTNSSVKSQRLNEAKSQKGCVSPWAGGPILPTRGCLPGGGTGPAIWRQRAPALSAFPVFPTPVPVWKTDGCNLENVMSQCFEVLWVCVPSHVHTRVHVTCTQWRCHSLGPSHFHLRFCDFSGRVLELVP